MLVRKKDPHGNDVRLLFVYEWDEVGELTHARRLSRAEIPLIDVLGIQALLSLDLNLAADGGLDLRYTYAADGSRVVKSDTVHGTHTLEVFSSLRLNDARYIKEDDAYERTPETETGYLISNGTALARVVYGDQSLPSLDGNRQYVYFTLTDPLGSTSIVIDKATSELVERATYLAFGQAETDYRPERWRSFREDYRFTGKEDDVGSGLTYFGARYYVSALGQWASADPLTVHGLGSDLNPYAYVMGSPQRFVDPNGLLMCISACTNWNGGGRPREIPRFHHEGRKCRSGTRVRRWKPRARKRDALLVQGSRVQGDAVHDACEAINLHVGRGVRARHTAHMDRVLLFRWSG